MLYQIEQHFWTGVGYGSFWAIGADSPNLHYNVDLVTAVGQAHNGYLDVAATIGMVGLGLRSEEHTSELQSLMRISYAVFCLKKKSTSITQNYHVHKRDNHHINTEPLNRVNNTP